MNRNVLIIVENLPVPFDTRVWKEAKSLRSAGYEVTVLCPRGKGFSAGYEVLEGIHIYRHPMPAEGNGAIGYIREYAAALFWELLYTSRIYLLHGFKVIQGCNPPDTVFLVAAPFRLVGVKYIFDQHDINPELYESKYDKRGFLYRVLVWLEWVTFKCSNVVISTNESYKQIAIARGSRDPRDVFVVRNGPDLGTFRPVDAKVELKHGKRYLVGYVGTMSIQEGLEILLDVAEHVRRVGRRDVHFTCVGGGPGLNRLKELTIAKGLEEMVDFTGRVSDRRLLEVLSTADVCVNPDKPCAMNDLSTMIKIMEYMALGKPIVQFDLKEGRFSAQEASLYVDPTNQVEDFASKILWLLDHPEERARMGAVGRNRVARELAWEHSVEPLLAAYERALRI